MDYLYSLYDALVSISVPSDKARAVVDAMERDMGTTLATKQDLEFLRRDVENRFALLEQRFDANCAQQNQKFDTLFAQQNQKFDAMFGQQNQKFDAMFGQQNQKFDATFARLDEKVDAASTRLDQKIDRLRDDMTRDLAALDLKMTVRLGSMLLVGFGLTIAAIRLWA